MNNRKYAGILLGAFLFCSLSARADDAHPWLPVNTGELRMKEFKSLPDAKAVLLYYGNEIDDTSHTSFYYSRTKILAESGKKYADLEIPMVGKVSVQQLAARTIHPDGKIVEFTGQPLEKVLLQGHGIKVRVQAIALPDVSVGDIVEYKYVLHYGDELHRHTWTVQHDLYALKETFRFKYDKRYVIKWLSYGNLREPEEDQKSNVLKLDLEDVLPFEAEEQMPPEDEFKQHVNFFYSALQFYSASRYWSETGAGWSRAVKDFLGAHHNDVDAAAQAAIGNETDPEKKLRKLYARAQQIRNLTYERKRTRSEDKKEDLKENKSAAEVLKHGYGDRSDIAMLFVAMAKGAGFDSSVVITSSRESHLFDPALTSFNQFDSVLAIVHLNGKTIYLDPGTRYCPYGLLRWMFSGTVSMDMKSPGDMANTPDSRGEDAITKRLTEVTLTPQGDAKGEVHLEFFGVEAMEWRLFALETDEAGRKKALEDGLKSWLPANSVVTMAESTGWDNEDAPLAAVFHVEVPAFASIAGKRLLIPTAFFAAQHKWALSSAARKYPLYFHYAHMEMDHFSVQLPEGYSVENLASPQAENAKFARYASKTSVSGQQVHLLRSLNFGGIYFPPDRYDDLRNFFVKVQADDESQTVLRPVPKAEAQKSN